MSTPETLIHDIREGKVSLVKPRYLQLQTSDMPLTPVIREPSGPHGCRSSAPIG